jgi:probable selenium-dependent hydroxylase accessory protein YqeC
VEVQIDSSFGLAEALRIANGDVVSLVGAGGKTTTLYAIAGELRRRGMTVIATTTTHMQSPRHPTTMPPLICAAEEEDWLGAVRVKVDRYGSAAVVGVRVEKDKFRGLEGEQIGALKDLADCVILEADRARGRSLKAPAPHESAVPEVTSLTVVMAGLDVLGMPLDESIVHRPEDVGQLTGSARGAPITEQIIAISLTRGYGARVPPGSRWVCFLNKADDSRLQSAEAVGKALISEGAPEVIFGQASRPQDCFYRMHPRPEKASD